VEYIVGDEFLVFCDQTFIKTCPFLDSYGVVTASIIERMEKIMQILRFKITIKNII